MWLNLIFLLLTRVTIRLNLQGPVRMEWGDAGETRPVSPHAHHVCVRSHARAETSEKGAKERLSNAYVVVRRHWDHWVFLVIFQGGP